MRSIPQLLIEGTAQMGGHGVQGTGGTTLGFLWSPLGVLLLLLVVLAIVGLVSRSGSATARTAPADASLATLRRRYARGEIDDEEFDKRRSRLAHRQE